MSRSLSVPLETLGRQAPPRFDNVSKDDILLIAHLALLLDQEDFRKTHPVDAAGSPALRPFMDRPPVEREEMGALVVRVLQALVMLGYVQAPE